MIRSGFLAASKLIVFLSCLWFSFSSVESVHAISREWLLSDPVPQPTCPTFPDPACYWYGEGPLSNPLQQSQPSFLIRSFYTRFDDVTNRWVVRTVLTDNSSIPGEMVPDTFWLVLNHGPMPFSTGLNSIIYFDANDSSNPKLTVYGYRAGHDLYDRSFEDGDASVPGNQPPDRICTSEDAGSCAGWLRRLSVSNDPVSGERTFEFDVDATAILAHVPLYSSGGAWHSRGPGQPARIFDQEVGLWFHPGIGRTFTYGASGFIESAVDGPAVGYYDGESYTSSIVAPSCALQTSVSSPLTCEGPVTTVDVNISTGPVGSVSPIHTSFAVICEVGGATITDNGSSAVVSVIGPGTGQATSCTVTLVVADGLQSAQCQTQFSVNACSLDCAGTPLGSAPRDSCGVCQGNNACFDCSGAPFGTNSVDRCGICAGDGQSCLNCGSVNIQGVQLALDGRALEIKGLVARALYRLRRVEGDTGGVRKLRRFAKAETNKEYINGWTAIYSVPGVFESCRNDAFCVAVSNDLPLATFDRSFSNIAALVRQILARIRRTEPGAGRAVENALRAVEKSAARDRAKVPASRSLCSRQ